MEQDNLEHRIDEGEREIIRRLKDIDRSDVPNINPKPLSASHHTQGEYIDMCNTTGYVLASCADYYNAAKHRKSLKIKLIPDDVRLDILHSIRVLGHANGHLSYMTILTGDAIVFDSHSLNAKIIKNYNSTLVKPSERQIYLPETSTYPSENYMTLKDFCKSITGIKALQAIFDTDDDPNKMVHNIKQIFSPYISLDTALFVPPKGSRPKNIASPIYFQAFPYYESNPQRDFRAAILMKKYDNNLRGRAYCLSDNGG